MHELPLYKIIDIRHHNGLTRTDDKYPDRIGSVVEILRPLCKGHSAILGYVSDKHGNPKSGAIMTSSVIRLNEQSDEITFSTINSIYVLKKL